MYNIIMYLIIINRLIKSWWLPISKFKYVNFYNIYNYDVVMKIIIWNLKFNHI